MNLELMAMRWLWLEKNCHYVLEQRTPRYQIGLPDVLGVTKDRYLVEIETKRTASDFRADFKKRHRAARDFYISKQPRQFYYLMPRELAKKLKDEIPAWAGLMQNHDNEFSVEIVKIAPVNKASERLSIRECVKMARCMTNHMMSYANSNATLFQRFLNDGSFDHTDWVGCENGTYTI
jgi:hypothetical protein